LTAQSSQLTVKSWFSTKSTSMSVRSASTHDSVASRA